jgi:probable rRNA maturation factor
MTPEAMQAGTGAARRRDARPKGALALHLQRAAASVGVPKTADMRRWALAALAGFERPRVELSVRVVDEGESAALNERYRGKRGPTNVLSFPFEDPPGVETDIIGDLVICAPVVEREAAERKMPVLAHWAHMVVHGVLHLRGYDHERDDDALVMEALETQILTGLGFDDPYA